MIFLSINPSKPLCIQAIGLLSASAGFAKRIQSAASAEGGRLACEIVTISLYTRSISFAIGLAHSAVLAQKTTYHRDARHFGLQNRSLGRQNRRLGL